MTHQNIVVRHLDVDPTNPIPLWGSSDQHNAYLRLTEDGVLTASQDYLGSASTEAQWHGREATWRIDRGLTVEQINDLLDDAAPLAQRVLDGREIVWDGDDWVGVYTEDADEAAWEVRALCERVSEDPRGAVVETHWSFGEWHAYYADGVEDEDLEAWVEQALAEAVANTVYFGYAMLVAPDAVTGLAAWIREERAAAQDDEDDEDDF